MKELPQEYENLLNRRSEEGRRLSGLEREFFGWDHADAAAMLAKQWNLPDDFIALIAHHTNLDDLLKSEVDLGAACVALASLLPSCSDRDWDESTAFYDGFTRLSGKSQEELRGLFEAVDEGTAEFAPILKLPTPKVSLVEYL